MVEVLTNNWVNLAVLLLQCGFLEFGYRLYKDYKKHHNEKQGCGCGNPQPFENRDYKLVLQG